MRKRGRILWVKFWGRSARVRKVSLLLGKSRSKEILGDAMALCHGGSRFASRMTKQQRGIACSNERETPRHKAVASKREFCAFF